jgi:hypothetical protein
MTGVWVDESLTYQTADGWHRLDPAEAQADKDALVREMERTWRECVKYGNPTPSMVCWKGLWIRIDGLVSDDAQDWRVPSEHDEAVIASLRELMAAALPISPDPPQGKPAPYWHQFRGKTRR